MPGRHGEGLQTRYTLSSRWKGRNPRSSTKPLDRPVVRHPDEKLDQLPIGTMGGRDRKWWKTRGKDVCV